MNKRILSRAFNDYGMALVLLLLCLYYSLATLRVQQPTGASGASRLIRQIPLSLNVFIVAGTSREDSAFAAFLSQKLAAARSPVVATVQGGPAEVRSAAQSISGTNVRIDIIACTRATANWPVVEDLPASFPEFRTAKILVPQTYLWPDFLKTENLLNVANQIAVIAIVAIGMTLVIIAAGIDLSVGSLIALAAVVATTVIRETGGDGASFIGMFGGAMAGIAVCAMAGILSGLLIACCGIPAFIATLAMMLVASGAAFIVARGQSIYQVPPGFTWLGRGAELGVPNSVLLMLVLYAIAHVTMARTRTGRYLYAVGGNAEAARLSGVPVKYIIVFAYAISGLLAGVGGIVTASQLRSGAPTYGQMYELYVIAAVVVGGTSLAGGEGKVLGTLIGAFIIAVIQNGMNLTGVESYTQKVVLGLVIVGAVLLDTAKRRGRDWLEWFKSRTSK